MRRQLPARSRGACSRDRGAAIRDRAGRRRGHHAARAPARRLVAGLPEELRYPLQLSTVEELTSDEIAEIMQIPEASVRTRLFRARKQLKEKLGVLMETRK